MTFDIRITGGRIVDGTRKPAFDADIGIGGDRIVAIEPQLNASARQTIDASGLCVAPGFVDVHNHSDGWMLKTPLQAPKILQGFTSEILGLDGIGYAPVNNHTWKEWLFYLRPLNGLRLDEYEGWLSIADFMQRLNERTTQNALTHIPYANVRSMVCGFGKEPPDARQMAEIQAEIHVGMQAGAVGLSTGLDYIVQCFSSTEELIQAARVVAEYDGLYVTHIRYKLGMTAALDEALQIAESAGVRLHISHLKPARNASAEEIFDWIEKARRRVPLTFDVYPYLPGSTMLNYLLPYDTWTSGPLAALSHLNREQIRGQFRQCLDAYKLQLDSIRLAWLPGRENASLQGMLLSDIVAQSGRDPEDALTELLIEERLAVLCVYLEGDDRRVEPFLQHDLYMMGTDGIFAQQGMIHPRHFGSAVRLLGPCVRDRRLFSLEDAVWKLSGHACRTFGLKDRGRIALDAFADLTVFDPQAVTDRATYDAPQTAAVGIRHVIVNGRPVVADGVVCHTESDTRLPGRFVKFGR